MGAVSRERFLTIDSPLNPPGVGQILFFLKVRVSMRAKFGRGPTVVKSMCTHPTKPQHHRRRRHIIPHHTGVRWVNFLGDSQSRLYPHMRAKFGGSPTALSKKVSFKCTSMFRPNLFIFPLKHFCLKYTRYSIKTQVH